MEDRVVINNNGREIETGDINVLGESSALADDRVFAELFRMSTSGVAKGVLPYAMNGSTPVAILQPDVTARTFIVNPFRAFVGVRSDAAGDGKKLWRDVRSVISPAGAAVTRALTLAANASGNPRWDLVYAVVAVDSDVSQTRFLKDPSDESVTAASYVTKKQTTLSIAVVQGTPAGSPTKPSLPADAGSNYNVPLAYVLVVDGATTLSQANVMDVAPILALAPSTAANIIRPASYCSTPDGALLTHVAWDLTGARRPGQWVPPSMVGGVSLIIPLRLSGAVSIATGEIVDNKIDWRRRFFRWQLQTGVATDLGSDLGASAFEEILPSPWMSEPFFGMGQSFKAGQSNASGAGGIDVLFISDSGVGAFSWDPGDSFALYVDMATGALKALIGGTPNAKCLFIWLEATAQFPNAGA
jgi:hypothetical protein